MYMRYQQRRSYYSYLAIVTAVRIQRRQLLTRFCQAYPTQPVVLITALVSLKWVLAPVAFLRLLYCLAKRQLQQVQEELPGALLYGIKCRHICIPSVSGNLSCFEITFASSAREAPIAVVS
jgi:hypothetical protein